MHFHTGAWKCIWICWWLYKASWLGWIEQKFTPQFTIMLFFSLVYFIKPQQNTLKSVFVDKFDLYECFCNALLLKVLKEVNRSKEVCSFAVYQTSERNWMWPLCYRWPWAQWEGRWAGFGRRWRPPARAARPVAAERGSGRGASPGTHPGPPPSVLPSPAQRTADTQIIFYSGWWKNVEQSQHLWKKMRTTGKKKILIFSSEFWLSYQNSWD